MATADRSGSATTRYFAHVRVFTGKPVSRAYVRDRETGTVVAACPHRHASRRKGGRVVVLGVTLAERCAKKLLRAFLCAAPERSPADGR